MELPDGLEHARSTPLFDENTVPAGIRNAHQVADGVWGRLVVDSGSVDFVFEDDPPEVIHLRCGDCQVIPPARLHHVQPVGPVTFHVEFHRRPRA